MSLPTCIEVGPSARIEWMYPNIYADAPLSRLVISMNHVRVSADLVIEFDSKRDGFVIRMDCYDDDADEVIVTRENVEIAFCPAWPWQKEDEATGGDDG